MQDQEKTYKSVCRICHGGCGALLTVKDGKLVKVMPDPDSPFNRGRMCVKGPATQEMMYHPSRLLSPLKRIGDRGSNQWKKVSWDAALSDIAGRMDHIRSESGSESIALGQGTGRPHYMHTVRFAYLRLRDQGILNLRLGRRATINKTITPSDKAGVESEIQGRLDEITTDALLMGLTPSDLHELLAKQTLNLEKSKTNFEESHS